MAIDSSRFFFVQSKLKLKKGNKEIRGRGGGGGAGEEVKEGSHPDLSYTIFKKLVSTPFGK